jgi:16S rRNA U1498 N3-methylase RsmE
MNLILLFDDDFVGPRRVRLGGRRLAYVTGVHRAAVGDALRVGQVNGRVGTGTVTALDERALVLDVSRFKPFVEDELRGLIAGTQALVAHPAAARPCPHAVHDPVSLAVGPEGGFTPYEVELLCAHGLEAVSLGARPLRVEHAVPALLGRILG